MTRTDDDDIRADFIAEAGELIERLGGQLVELESRPQDTELLNAIFRAFHTVKGGAGFLNLQGFVHQVAQHLLAQSDQLFRADLAAAGGHDQGDALVDIGAGDHFTVDDHGRGAVVGIVLAEDRRVAWQVKRPGRPLLGERGHGQRGGDQRDQRKAGGRADAQGACHLQFNSQ